MRPDPKGATYPARVQRVPRRLTDDNVRMHYYHRPTRRRLPDPASPDFAMAYAEAEREYARILRLQRVQNSQRTVSAPPLAPNYEGTNSSSSTDGNEKAAETFYTPEEIVRRWRGKIDIATLANWRSKRQGPAYHRFGRAIFYRADLLASWESRNMIVCDPISVTEREDDGV